MDLFRQSEDDALSAHAPLAVRMRPRTIDEIVGQEDFLGPGKMLRRMLEAGSAVVAGVLGAARIGQDDARPRDRPPVRLPLLPGQRRLGHRQGRPDIIEGARAALAATGKRTVLFMDELHRFNRAQQDVLLNDVENGVIILIGATTENPFFTINSPLLSRSTIFQFAPLTHEQIVTLLRRALADKERGLGQHDVEITDEALDHLATICDGDARRALTALEVGVLSQLRKAGRKKRIVFDLQVAQESIQAKAIQYDRTGDLHYDAASAFIKSMRGSDPDAAVYWLARMLEAGEDPRFIARRIAILASEDIGNADPRAISVAAAAFDITERIGMPECRITLAQAAIYMACAPKSNASYLAVDAAWTT